MSTLLDALTKARFETHTPRNGRVVWVSEIAACLRRAYLDRVSPKPVSFSVQAVREMGAAVHKLLASVLRNNGMESEVSVARVVDGYLVKGRVDAIIFEDDGVAVLEAKTAEDTSLREDFARQARFYAAMLGASRAYVLVVNRNDGSYAIHKLDVNPVEAPRELEERVRKLQKALEEKREPEPKKGPWCRWCPYREECPAWREN